jgi:hypothetical protein
MALSQTSSSQMISDLMLLQPVILGSQNAMNAVDGATIERRIRISQLDEGSARCKVSRAWDPRKDSSHCMQQHKIPLTSSGKNADLPFGLGGQRNSAGSRLFSLSGRNHHLPDIRNVQGTTARWTPAPCERLAPHRHCGGLPFLRRG